MGDCNYGTCNCDYEKEKNFYTAKLVGSLTSLTETCLVFHRESSSLQEYDIERENYLFDFIIQAVELAEVKAKLMAKDDGEEEDDV
jgi:hypothetical protein